MCSLPCRYTTGRATVVLPLLLLQRLLRQLPVLMAMVLLWQRCQWLPVAVHCCIRY